jgi:hypothetical protein
LNFYYYGLPGQAPTKNIQTLDRGLANLNCPDGQVMVSQLEDGLIPTDTSKHLDTGVE